jgi:hypothetical protein
VHITRHAIADVVAFPSCSAWPLSSGAAADGASFEEKGTQEDLRSSQ